MIIGRGVISELLVLPAVLFEQVWHDSCLNWTKQGPPRPKIPDRTSVGRSRSEAQIFFCNISPKCPIMSLKTLKHYNMYGTARRLRCLIWTCVCTLPNIAKLVQIYPNRTTSFLALLVQYLLDWTCIKWRHLFVSCLGHTLSELA